MFGFMGGAGLLALMLEFIGGPGLLLRIMSGAGLLALIGCGLAALGMPPIPGPGLRGRCMLSSLVPGLLPCEVRPDGYAAGGPLLAWPHVSVLFLISLLVKAGCGTPSAGGAPTLAPS
jgi:hypothetical protein